MLIAVTSYLAISSAVNHILGTWFVVFPWLLIPLGLALFLASKLFTDHIPFLHGNGYLGQVLQILLVIVSYSIFTKSLFYYVDVYVQQYAYTIFLIGFIGLVYATKHHLKSVGNANG